MSGSGWMPQETQTDGRRQATVAAGNQPGGGTGAAINTPETLTKYKGWILGGLFLLLGVAAAFLYAEPHAKRLAVRLAPHVVLIPECRPMFHYSKLRWPEKRLSSGS